MNSKPSNDNEEDITGGLQIICCPINRVVSDVRPLPLEDRVPSNISKGNISLGRKPSLPLEDRVSSNISRGNISLGRKPSRVSFDEQQQQQQQQQPSADEQVGTETEGAGADAGQVIEVQKSRSVLSGLFRKSSRVDEQSFVEEQPSVVTVTEEAGADADAEQVLEVKKSRSVLSGLFGKSSRVDEQSFVGEQASTGGADADAGQVLEVQKSRSVLSGLSRKSSSSRADEQSCAGLRADADAGQVLEVKKSRSVLSQGGLEIRVREDGGIAVEPSCSRSGLSQNVVEKPQSMYNSQSGSASVQGPSIHAGEGDIGIEDIDIAAVPYGHAHYETSSSMGRDRKKWGLGLVALCVFVGLCAALITLSVNTQHSALKEAMNRFQGDSDGDGIKDELELVLGLDPLKADTDGDGLSDGEELELLLKKREGAMAMMGKTSKTPASTKTPKAASLGTSATTMMMVMEPKTPKAPAATKSPKPPASTKTPKRKI